MAKLPNEQALAYLDALEADRMAALALTEQKAEEAKLIQARQEGFRAALDILCGETSAGDAVSGHRARAVARVHMVRGAEHPLDGAPIAHVRQRTGAGGQTWEVGAPGA